MANNRLVYLENTNFLYRTNFSGNPARDERFHSRTRKGNIIIPTQEQADELAAMGVNVKVTNPKEGEEEGFVPTFFVSAVVNYDSEIAKSRPPKVYLVVGNREPSELDAESIGTIDGIADARAVSNVNATLELSHSKTYDCDICYIRTMYVEQNLDDDPYASRYAIGSAAQNLDAPWEE